MKRNRLGSSGNRRVFLGVFLSGIGTAFFLSPAAQTAVTDDKVSGCFSSTYQQARRKLIHAALDAEGRLESYTPTVTGPEGHAIHMDVLYFGPEQADTVLVLGSGTHGVEGFAGSAIQTCLLRGGITERLPQGVGLMMIHAINPYGFAHIRRVNEDNVDLNRNFVDFTRPLPVNKGYDAVTDVAEPVSLSRWENLKARLRLYWYVLKAGKPALQSAISQGQFTHPQGLFYGGGSASWSNSILSSMVKSRLSHAKRVIMIDVHTGLGDYGEAEVIMNVPKNTPAYQRATACWGKQLKTTVEGGSVSVDINGPLKLAIPKLLPDADVTAVSLELGTFPATDVFWALRAENWLHHYGTDDHLKREAIKDELLHVFYPDDIVWKQAVWTEGSEVLRRALTCIVSNSTSPRR